MFESMASHSRLASSAAWTIASSVNRAAGRGAARTKLGAGSASEEAPTNANEDGGSEAHPILCPDCNREAVEAVIKGQSDVADFRECPGLLTTS